MWAVGVLISAFLVFVTAGTAAKTGADFASKAAGRAVAQMHRCGARHHARADQRPRKRHSNRAGNKSTGARARSRHAGAGRAASGGADETRAQMSRILVSSVASGSITQTTERSSRNWWLSVRAFRSRCGAARGPRSMRRGRRPTKPGGLPS